MKFKVEENRQADLGHTAIAPYAMREKKLQTELEPAHMGLDLKRPIA